MKTILLSLTILSSITSQALANESACAVKMKNAASYDLAQTTALPVQSVSVVKYAPGPWTEAVGDNTGSNLIQVQIVDIVENYRVSGQQIGTSSDCSILSVEKLD